MSENAVAEERVLIVEDSAFYAAVLDKVVRERLGLETRMCASLAEAAAIVAAEGDSIFLALLDLTLPDSMDGEIIDHMNARGIPSVVFTAQYSDEIRRRLMARDVVDYVIKNSPASLEFLIGLVKRLHRNRAHRALVVEDSQTWREMVARLLRKYRFEVTTARDGREALAVMDEGQQPLSLVVTDHEMPRMDGLTLIREIRRRYPPEVLPIIGLSSAENRTLSIQFIKNGANDFLGKPFEPEEFFCRVSQNMDMLDSLVALREAATLDYLTRLPNRRHFFATADTCMSQSRALGTSMALAVMDIDYFKTINDTHGHDAGDTVLRQFSQVLRDNTRGDDVVARHGGEEFVVLAPGLDRTRAAEVFERLGAAIAATSFTLDDGQVLTVTASIGVCVAPDVPLETMIGRADAAVYAAKEGGRNRVCFDDDTNAPADGCE